MTPDEALVTDTLDALEQVEARLLTWGLVDGFITQSEIFDIIDPLLDDKKYIDTRIFSQPLTFGDFGDVINTLIDRALLFNVAPQGDQPRYRTRMAETVRLLFRLRQLFPKHRDHNDWQTAASLVADFRFSWRRRRYPRRSLSIDDAQKVINKATPDLFIREAFNNLIEGYGEKIFLAKFQVDASARIITGLENQKSIATLISSGTGSGKTLAFYLPCLSRISSHIRKDPSSLRWVKVLALYPRNELLKDQFSEVFNHARSLDKSLQESGCRKIIIGAFFGPTPEKAEYINSTTKGWRVDDFGSICEYIRCPKNNCNGDMLWQQDDMLKETERLVCKNCTTTIESDEIILTRKRLKVMNPDILFTTTEMLNQRIGDSTVRHLFGVGKDCKRSVEIMLLDEVHTYSGTGGAQVAYLLRRWRHMLKRPVSFVGLSATLPEGARFFSILTGIYEQNTLEITPQSRDMIAEGAEYLLALRGDPVSRTALLSTTIQSAMLLSRMLDAPERPLSEGAYGQRLFVFADNIDVINRMYFAMLDAEGRSGSGNVDVRRHPSGGLATLRSPRSNELRKNNGQDWQVAVDIGHSLQSHDRKSVGRVMSMDPGVGSNLDIIVASASLEVGYNDPLVGAVIQHKSPADIAQFLQRKGRAGRSRNMRPWTVAVLSDYGRDRISYQGYETLFDPKIPIRSLPINNRYVTRIQAVYATMDFLSRNIEGDRGSIWKNLSEPSNHINQKKRQKVIANKIEDILINETNLERYLDYLGDALKLTREQIVPLMWEHPRPLLTEVLPTALRRLETYWINSSGQLDNIVNQSPLPEFVPAALFSDLNLPEVKIFLGEGDEFSKKPETMPISQAMKEYAPGRLSRRFGLTHALDRHWICPTIDQNRAQTFDLEPHVKGDFLGDWKVYKAGKVTNIAVYRPKVFVLIKPGFDIVDSSNASLQWETQILTTHTNLNLHPPIDTPWTELVNNIAFYTHQSLCPAEVRRMAISSNANIRYKNGKSVQKEFTFNWAGKACALGFNISVDAICLKLNYPNALWDSLGSEQSEKYRAMRTARFHDEAINGPYLQTVDNHFAREWLARLMITAISHEAILKIISIKTATENLRNNSANLNLTNTLDVLFQSPVIEDDDGSLYEQDKLRKDLADFISNPDILNQLFTLAEILWDPITADWENWLRKRFLATGAAAVLNAILDLCPEIDGNGLVIDLDAGPKEINNNQEYEINSEIWISETSPGGNGQIEAIQQKYSEDPRRFFNLMTSALRDNDFLLSDYQLNQFLKEVNESPNGALASVTKKYRDAYGVSESFQAITELRETLSMTGFIPFHSFIVALANRILKPGTSIESDTFFLNAIRHWNTEEERLGVELDARVIAYGLSLRVEIDLALNFAGITTPNINPTQWRFGVIYGLLWPRGAQIRTAGLALWSPYTDLPTPDPLLITPFLHNHTSVIEVNYEHWKSDCLQRLGDVGAVTLTCDKCNANLLSDALSFLAANPVQSGYLSIFARVQAVRTSEGKYFIDLDIAEALQ